MRFGIIGCGSIAHAHMKALASIDGAEIAAVCDISADLAQKAAESTGAAVYTDYREMARQLGKSRKSVDNALYRIRRKLNRQQS